MKRTYEEPSIKPEQFMTEDVITTSGTAITVTPTPTPSPAPTPAPTEKSISGGGGAGTGEYGGEL